MTTKRSAAPGTQNGVQLNLLLTNYNEYDTLHLLRADSPYKLSNHCKKGSGEGVKVAHLENTLCTTTALVLYGTVATTKGHMKKAQISYHLYCSHRMHERHSKVFSDETILFFIAVSQTQKTLHITTNIVSPVKHEVGSIMV